MVYLLYVSNVIRTLLKLVAFPFCEVGFLVLREDSNEEDGKAFVPVDVDNTRSTALAPIANPARTLRKPPVFRISSPHFASAATMATISDISDSLKNFRASAR
jgi:hypothetical protein